MSFDVTTKDIQKALTPLGFEVDIDAQFDDEDYLLITHPAYEGIVIEVSVLNDDKEFDQITRKVEGGVEGDLDKGYTEESFQALTESERKHLYNIDFGEDIDYDTLNSMADFVSMVQTKIVPVTVL